MALVFLGGVHGAGKGHLGNQLARRVNLHVADVERNQRDLLATLEAKQFRTRHILLDGHFALLDSTGEPKEVPRETFSELMPTALVVLGVEPVVAHQRLLARDGTAPSTDLLAALQEMELAHAQTIARQLSIPALFLWSSDVELSVAFLRPIVEGEAGS